MTLQNLICDCYTQRTDCDIPSSPLYFTGASRVALVGKNPPASAGAVRPLGREDPNRQPTPVLLPGESHGQRTLAGYSPWGHKESDTTEVTQHAHTTLLGQMVSTVLPEFSTKSCTATSGTHRGFFRLSCLLPASGGADMHPLFPFPLLLTTHSSHRHVHRDADLQPYFRTKTYMEIGISDFQATALLKL